MRFMMRFLMRFSPRTSWNCWRDFWWGFLWGFWWGFNNDLAQEPHWILWWGFWWGFWWGETLIKFLVWILDKNLDDVPERGSWARISMRFLHKNHMGFLGKNLIEILGQEHRWGSCSRTSLCMVLGRSSWARILMRFFILGKKLCEVLGWETHRGSCPRTSLAFLSKNFSEFFNPGQDHQWVFGQGPQWVFVSIFRKECDFGEVQKPYRVFNWDS